MTGRASGDLTTSLEVHRGTATYVVVTAVPLYQEGLMHMGYTQGGKDTFKRSFPASPSISKIHERFAGQLQRIVRQSARLESVQWQPALKEFLHRVKGSQLQWFLAGSGALAVRGLAVEPGDLDFVVSDARLAGRLFRDLLVEPVRERSGWAARWFGRAFHEALFEWISDANPALDVPEPQEVGPAAARQLERVGWRGHTVRVPPLSLQLRVAQRRGLDARAEIIRRAMSEA
jgi:hypothetical protein